MVRNARFTAGIRRVIHARTERQLEVHNRRYSFRLAPLDSRSDSYFDGFVSSWNQIAPGSDFDCDADRDFWRDDAYRMDERR